jgi:hypothetical protein
LAQLQQARGILGERERALFVLREVGRNQLGQAERLEERPRHACGKRLAGARQYRHASPQGIARSRAPIERQGIEEEVGAR